jgi:hypothetical protein
MTRGAERPLTPVRRDAVIGAERTDWDLSLARIPSPFGVGSAIGSRRLLFGLSGQLLVSHVEERSVLEAQVPRV